MDSEGFGEIESGVEAREAIAGLVQRIETQLRREVQLVSEDAHHPVILKHLPAPWRRLGAGNYAAVVYHPDYADFVVKVYAPGRPGFEQEVEVYRRLGRHPAFSQCFYAQAGILVLKRLYGTTLYDCLHQGIVVPPSVIEDIDAALVAARDRGLYPHDVHGRNVMLTQGQSQGKPQGKLQGKLQGKPQGRGLVVDISDFLNPDPCSAWEDLKWAYYRLYWPIVRCWPLRVPLRVPYVMLDGVRGGYRIFRRWFRQGRNR